MYRQRCDELLFKPDKNYLRTVQKGLHPIDDRAAVVNFMIYSSARLQLYTDTLHLAVRNLDRFLSVKHFPVRNFELLGLALLFDSAKHLESLENTPWAAEIVKNLEKAITVKEEDIVNTETEVLMTLNFDMVVPTAITFIRSVIERADPIEGVQFEKLQFLTEFLGELTLLEYKFLRYNPSLIAASIIYYALLILNPNNKYIWNQNLRELTGYSLRKMRECVKDIYDVHRNEEFRKDYDCADQVYCRQNLLCVAKLNPVPLPPGFARPIEEKWNRRNSL